MQHSFFHLYISNSRVLPGMNVNQREMGTHIEFEPTTYYAAFSAELEASAYPMWALVSHLRGPESAEISRRALNFCLTALTDWLDAINFTSPDVVSNLRNIFVLRSRASLKFSFRLSFVFQKKVSY